METKEFFEMLASVREAVAKDAPNLTVSVEFPGCVVAEFAKGDSLWAGTINGPWTADWMSVDGAEALAAWQSALPDDTQDVGAVSDWFLSAALACTILREVFQAAKEDQRFGEVQSFAELHDLCDANMLGETSETLDRLGQERAIPVINTAQEMADEWLRTVDWRTDQPEIVALQNDAEYARQKAEGRKED